MSNSCRNLHHPLQSAARLKFQDQAGNWSAIVLPPRRIGPLMLVRSAWPMLFFSHHSSKGRWALTCHTGAANGDASGSCHMGHCCRSGTCHLSSHSATRFMVMAWGLTFCENRIQLYTFLYHTLTRPRKPAVQQQARVYMSRPCCGLCQTRQHVRHK